MSGLAMAIMGVWGIDRGSMYGTEEVSYWAAHLPLGSLWHLLGHVDAVHGLYYLLMHGVFLFGSGETLLRVPSVIGMVVAGVLTARVGYRLSGSPAVSLVAGLILAATPVVDNYAQVGRSYAIDVALVMLASLVLLRAVDSSAGSRSSWRPWILYGTIVAVSGYMHEMTVLMLLAHGVTLLWSRTDRALIRRWAVCAGGALVVMVPIIVISHAEDSALAWITFHGWADAWQLLTGFFGPAALSVAAMVLLIAVACLPGRWSADARTGAEATNAAASAGVSLTRFALPLMVVPGAALLIESAIATPLYGGVRYVLYSVAAAALLAALGTQRLGLLCARLTGIRWSVHILGTVVVLAILLAGVPAQFVLRTPAGRPQDMNGASAFVAANARTGDAILYIPGASSLAPLAYPDDFVKVDEIALAVSPQTSGEFYGIAKPLGRLENDMLARRRIWEFSDIGTTGMSSRQKAERSFLHRDFHRVRGRSFTGVSVSLWVHDTAGH